MVRTRLEPTPIPIASMLKNKPYRVKKSNWSKQYQLEVKTVYFYAKENPALRKKKLVHTSMSSPALEGLSCKSLF